jgi:hypothetical protein
LERSSPAGFAGAATGRGGLDGVLVDAGARGGASEGAAVDALDAALVVVGGGDVEAPAIEGVGAATAVTPTGTALGAIEDASGAAESGVGGGCSRIAWRAEPRLIHATRPSARIAAIAAIQRTADLRARRGGGSVGAKALGWVGRITEVSIGLTASGSRSGSGSGSTGLGALSAAAPPRDGRSNGVVTKLLVLDSHFASQVRTESRCSDIS